MPILLLVLQVIAALPQLIQVIQEILKMIHGQNGQERVALMKDFEVILQKHARGQCQEDVCTKDLEDFKQHLVEKYS